MELDRFLDRVTVVQSNSPRNALEVLISAPNNNKVVKYKQDKQFLILSLGVLEINNGVALFDYAVVRDGDIVSDIEANVRFDLVIGGTVYNGNNRVLVVNCVYHEIKIRFYLDPNNLPEHIECNYTVSLLSNDLRTALRQEPLVLCDDLRYANGMAIPR